MSKPKQVQTTTNTYGFFTPPKTAARDAVADFKFESDPSFGATFSNLKNKRRERRNALTSPYDTPEMRLQEDYAGDNEIAQNEAQGRRALSYDNNRMKYGQLMDVAGLDKPVFANTGGTSTGQEQGGFWRGLLDGGLGAGMSFL